MIDVGINAKIVRELERLLLLARSGEIVAIGVSAIRKDGTGDTVLEMQPQPILVMALGGSLHAAAQFLTDAQIRETERLTKIKGAA